MKKISFLTLLLFACAYTFGQSTTSASSAAKSSSPTFGIKGGVNVANFIARDFGSTGSPNLNTRVSFLGGITMHAPLGTSGLAIQPELLYSGQGSKMSTTTTTYVGTVPTTTTNAYDQVMHYVSLPIMFQWKSMGGFLLELGPVPAYLVSAKQKGPGDKKTGNIGNFDKFDLAGAGGIGFQSRMGLGIGARYNYGFTNVLQEKNTGYPSGAKLRNSVISIALSWQLGANR